MNGIETLADKGKITQRQREQIQQGMAMKDTASREKMNPAQQRTDFQKEISRLNQKRIGLKDLPINRVNNAADGGTAEQTGEDLINEQYRLQKEAQEAQLEAQRAAQEAAYNLQLEHAGESYDTMRAKASTDSAMAERARRERMANMGMSGAGGKSMTLAQRDTNARLGAIGSANRQEQGTRDNINMALTNLGTQFNADKNSMMAQLDATRNAELSQYRQWKSGIDMQKEQAQFDKAFALLSKRRISKKQFEELTGIKIR